MADVVVPPTEPFLGPAPASDRMPQSRKWLLYASPFAFCALAVAVGFIAYPHLPHDLATPYAPQRIATNTSDTVAPDGHKLFLQHCANCHGIHGDGNGVANLTVRARYFGFDKYKFGNTEKATPTGDPIPTDDNLNGILLRGIPGSAMPDFKQLTQAERDALIVHVRHLTWRGTYERLLKKAQKDYDDGGDDVSLPKVARTTDTACLVGPSLKIPDIAPRPESMAKGQEIFSKVCAACHGPGGLGDGPQTKDPKFINENGSPATPRNLTSGLYKGGDEDRHLYARLYLGIPGTPMPASGTAYSPQEIADLVVFVRSLVKAQ